MSDSSRRHLAIAPHAEAPSSPEHEFEEEQLLQVGELAKATDKTVRAIHLYESMGLIEPVRRSKGRYRLFSPDTKVRVRWISKLQSLGLSLGIPTTTSPRESNRSATCEPMKPATPVIRTFTSAAISSTARRRQR